MAGSRRLGKRKKRYRGSAKCDAMDASETCTLKSAIAHNLAFSV